MLIYALVAGVLFGLYFSLVGIGLNLVFGVMRIVNLAHGDILMLGAFVAFGVVTFAGIDPLRACCSIGCWCRGCRARSIRRCCRSSCSSACRR
jgi:branched-subunit amino acid ABC-type transport system permease component